MVELMIYIPFIGFFLSFFVKSKWLGVFVSLIELILTVIVRGEGEIILSKILGLKISAKLDGLNILLLWLNSFLFFLVFVYALQEKKEREREYQTLFLFLLSLLQPAFLTTNVLAFYFFFDATLIPMFLIIGIWGTGRKVYSAFKFLLFTFSGSIFFLISVIYIGFKVYEAKGFLSFEYSDVLEVVRGLEYKEKLLLFLGFFIAFAVKIPLIPLHVWLPDAHTEAPTGGSVILAGILLKLGSYAFLRFSFPFFPEIVKDYQFLIGLLGVLGIIVGAFLALSQEDIKRIIAYSSVSHMGYIMLGSVIQDMTALRGAIIHMINHGISTGALFFLIGMIYERTHTRKIGDYGGLAGKIPLYTTMFFIFTLSSIGFPSTGGFIGEFLVVVGAIKNNILLGVLSAIGAILSASYMLILVLKMFFGKEGKVILESGFKKQIHDIRIIEIFVLFFLSIFVFWIGIYPKTFFRIIDEGVRYILSL